MVHLLQLLAMMLSLLLPPLNASNRSESLEKATSWLIMPGMTETTVCWLMGSPLIHQTQGGTVNGSISYSYRHTSMIFDGSGSLRQVTRR